MWRQVIAREDAIEGGIESGRAESTGVCQSRQVPMKSKKMALMVGLRAILEEGLIGSWELVKFYAWGV